MLPGMKRLDCLDGVRGVLAMYVVLGHMAPFVPLPPWLQSTVSHGGAAVDVFFILSGLVITQSLDRLGGDRGRFLLARVLRLYPVYLPVLALAVVVQPLPCGFALMPWIGADSAAHDICSDRWQQPWPAEVAAHVVMAHGLFPNGVLPNAWVSFLGSAWSLSTEWQFYVLAMFAWRHGERRMIRALLMLAVAGMAWHAMAPEPWQFSRAFLPNRAHFFALGVASQAVVRTGVPALPRYLAVLCVTLPLCAVHGQVGKLLPPLVWSVCLAAQLLPRRPGLGLLHRALRCRTALWFGAISYPIYLVNEPIHKVLAPLLGMVAGGNAGLFSALWLPAAVGLPILAAAWLHRHIEAPAMRWRRARVTPPRPEAIQFGPAVRPVPVQRIGRGL